MSMYMLYLLLQHNRLNIKPNLTSKRHLGGFTSDGSEPIAGDTVVLPRVTCLIQAGVVERQFPVTDSVGCVGDQCVHLTRVTFPLPEVRRLRIADSYAFNAGEVGTGG